MKRTIILDRLLMTSSQFKFNIIETTALRLNMLSDMETKEFFIHSFFNENATEGMLLQDFDFIIKRISKKYFNYQRSLKNMFYSFLYKIPVNNYDLIRSLVTTITVTYS